MQAVDAASAPNPSATTQTSARPSTPPHGSSRAAAAVPPSSARQQRARAAAEHAKSSFVSPVVRFSSVVWLQVTGVFFALIAFTMGTAAWRARAGLHEAIGSPAAIKVYAYVAFCALFTYFTVSSFVRAARR